MTSYIKRRRILTHDETNNIKTKTRCYSFIYGLYTSLKTKRTYHVTTYFLNVLRMMSHGKFVIHTTLIMEFIIYYDQTRTQEEVLGIQPFPPPKKKLGKIIKHVFIDYIDMKIYNINPSSQNIFLCTHLITTYVNNYKTVCLNIIKLNIFLCI